MSLRLLHTGCIAGFLMLAAIPLVAGGDAWTLPSDGRIIRFGIISTTAEEEFDFQGGRREIFSDTALFHSGQFGMTDVSFYGELGFTDWLTGTLSTQYRVAVREAKLRATGRDSTLSASGLGDIWLGGRMRLLPVEDSTAATVMVGVKIPTGSRNQSIPLGTGVLDYEISAAAGRRFRLADMLSATAQLSAGFRLRNVANNEFVYMAQGGVNLARVLLVQLTLDGVLSTGGYDPARDASIDAFIGDQSFFRWNMGLVYSTADNMELRVDYGRQVAGRNALAGHSIAFGIAWKK